MRTVSCSRSQVFQGPLRVVNREHPLRGGAPVYLQPPSDRCPDVLLERRADRCLAACLRQADGRGEILPVSGWRSRARQKGIWDGALAVHGGDFTERFVALPGCSEHETGLAVDLAWIGQPLNRLRPSFPDAGACAAFRRLAADHGFILRYPAEREACTGIAHEPWHFRYVGVPHARLMEANGLCLEEYAGFLQAGPRRVPLPGGRAAQVFYVPCAGAETPLPLPTDCCRISGDNVSGFIVTAWETRP